LAGRRSYNSYPKKKQHNEEGCLQKQPCFACVSLLNSLILIQTVTVLCGLLLFTTPAHSQELPLAVSPSLVNPGETFTVTGTGFQPGARGLVWNGGPFVKGNLDRDGFLTAVSVEGDYAYVLDTGLDKLLVIDVSDPANPIIVGSVNATGLSDSIAVANGYAYVLADGGLQVVDISTPTAPEIVGSSNIGSSNHISVANGYAYVARPGGLHIIDISTPTTPVVVGSVNISYPTDVTVENGYAYVVDSNYSNPQDSGLKVIDISSPIAPVIVGSVSVAHSGQLFMAVSNGYAYLARSSGPEPIKVIDIRSPTAPVVVGRVHTPGDIYDLTAANGYLYVASSHKGMQIIDISTPTAPAIVGSVPHNSRGVAVENGYAYVAGAETGLRVIDVSHPVNPIFEGREDSENIPSGTRAMAIANGHAYMERSPWGEDSHLLAVLDIGAPASPVLVGSVNLSSEVNVVVAETTMFMVLTKALRLLLS